MQPDREDAERDDADVEVAAHLFFASLSRGLCSHNDESWVCNPGFDSLHERCESPLWSRLGV